MQSICGQCKCEIRLFLMYNPVIHLWYIEVNNAKGIKNMQGLLEGSPEGSLGPVT